MAGGEDDPYSPPPGYHSDLSRVVVGSHVAGCFTEDGVWYPAVVDQVIPGERPGEASSYFVTYTQYGNSEMIPAERLRAEPGSGPSQAEAEAAAAAEATEVAAACAAVERVAREERMAKDAALSGVGASPLYGALGSADVAGRGGRAGAVAAVVQSGDWDEATGAAPPVIDSVAALSAGLSQFQFDQPSPDDVVVAARVAAGRSIIKGGAVPPGAAESSGGGRKPPVIIKKGGGPRLGPKDGATGKALGAEIFKSGEEMRAAPRVGGPPDDGGRKGKKGGTTGKKAVATAAAKAAKEDSSTKRRLNLVVAGHVDAGKSTLMGRMLFELGAVSQRTMHKFEK